MTSQHFAVVGDPIEHSLSPRIHSAAYNHLGLDWDYSKHQVPKGELATFLSKSGSNLSGVSVTMPLKFEAAELSQSSDEIVKLLGVANTLLKSNESWLGYNTDVFGIQKALQPAWTGGVSKVAILGAGATAQSSLYAISLSAPAATVRVYVRNVSTAEEISLLGSKLGVELEVHQLAEYVAEQDLTISTVPAEALGQIPQLEQHGWLLNVNYASVNESFSSPFYADRVVNGEVMLIWQAIAQIRLFLNGDLTHELEDESLLYVKMLEAL
jgi:shikimate dehydrogenase